MPRLREHARVRATMLTHEQRLELMRGPQGDESAFGSDRHRRAAWLAHRDHLPRLNAGYRPWGFWWYEAPPELRGDGPATDDELDQVDALLGTDDAYRSLLGWNHEDLVRTIALGNLRREARLRWLAASGHLTGGEVASIVDVSSPDRPNRRIDRDAGIVLRALGTSSPYTDDPRGGL